MILDQTGQAFFEILDLGKVLLGSEMKYAEEEMIMLVFREKNDGVQGST